jgi:tetratricopeptide (TPR) repeat protein
MQNLQQIYQHAIDNGDLDTAEQALRATLAKVPHDNHMRLNLANFLVQYRNGLGAAELFTENDPDNLFNRAYYLSKAHRSDEAIAQYQRAIDAGLSDAHEAYCNIGSLYRDQHNQDDQAEQAFIRALQLSPGYSAAIINLANLYEDRGFKDKAEDLLSQISERDPYYPQALCRLAGLGVNEAINRALHQQLQQQSIDPDTRCDMLYAIGHQWDKLGEYDHAKRAFDAANQLNQQLIPSFDNTAWQARLDETLAGLNTKDLSPVSDETVFFICGMFRSGSTLLEQMLAAHPDIAAGGELTFFPQLAAKRFEDTASELTKYRSQLQSARQNKRLVSDKRNDNIWHIDLIKALFPNAKIFITDRNSDDCALSIYQQRLGPSINYACDMTHIKQYESHCQALREHWLQKYPGDVLIISYEDIISEPQKAISTALGHLGRSWNDACLDFQKLRNTVKTASVWQVRQPLNDRSIGRAKNYLKG